MMALSHQRLIITTPPEYKNDRIRHITARWSDESKCPWDTAWVSAAIRDAADVDEPSAKTKANQYIAQIQPVVHSEWIHSGL